MELLGSEDDVLTEMCMNLLKSQRYVRASKQNKSRAAMADACFTAQHQGNPDLTHGIPGEGGTCILQSAMDAMSQRASQ